MNNQRDYSIDFFKGLSILGIIFIHTTWWSGADYVPNWLAQLSLLVDVPLFFFLSGCSATFSFKKENPFSGIIRMVIFFTLFYLTYSLFIPANSLEYTYRAFFMHYSPTPSFEVVVNSLWFTSVFLVTYIIAYLIIKHFGEKRNVLLAAIFSFFIHYLNQTKPEFSSVSVLSSDTILVLGYLVFFLLGYYYFSHKHFKATKKIALVIFLLASAYFVYFLSAKGFVIHSIKFPIKTPYVLVSLISISLVPLFADRVNKNYKINFLGRNALVFYLAQGISSSLLFKIEPYLSVYWPLKLTLLFLINISLAILIAIPIVYIFKVYLKWSVVFLKKLDG